MCTRLQLALAVQLLPHNDGKLLDIESFMGSILHNVLRTSFEVNGVIKMNLNDKALH